MMKKIFMLIGAGLALVLVVGFVGKNFFLRKGIESGAKFVTGMELTIQKLSLGLFSSDLRMQGVALLNPEGYKDKKMLSVPEIYGSLSISHLFKKQIYLNDARFNMDELLVVKNNKGKVNIAQLKGLFPSPLGKKEKAAPSESWPLTIKRLELSVGRVVFTDYSHGEKPKTYVFKVGIEKEMYRDIKDPQVFVSLLLTRALAKTAVAKLANINMGEVKALAQATMDDSVMMAKEGASTAQGAVSVAKDKTQEAWDASKETTKEATTKVKDGAAEATQQIKDLFGK